MMNNDLMMILNYKSPTESEILLNSEHFFEVKRTQNFCQRNT